MRDAAIRAYVCNGIKWKRLRLEERAQICCVGVDVDDYCKAAVPIPSVIHCFYATCLAESSRLAYGPKVLFRRISILPIAPSVILVLQ